MNACVKIFFAIGVSLVIIIVFCLAVCPSKCIEAKVDRQEVADHPEPEEGLVMANQGLALSEPEVSTLTQEALIGSPEAAWRLSGYYEFFRFDHQEGLFWEQIAAENGSPAGQHGLALTLLESSSPRDKFRVRFWLERAVANGSSLAFSLLGKLPPE